MAKRDPRIDAYIEKAADFAKPILKHLRKVVHAGCPNAEETVKWSMPHFDYKGPLAGMAAALHLDGKRFATELAAGVHADRVRRDFRSGIKSGVNGTPTFFINGVRHDAPWDQPTLLAAVEAAAVAPARR